MPLISLQGQNVILNKLKFDKRSKIFKLSNGQDIDKNTFTFDYILPVDNEYLNKDFDLYILNSNKFSENSIFQVFENSINKRIGWIFPITSLISNEHSKATDKHFQKVAYPAFQLLLLNTNNVKILQTGQEYYLTNSKDYNALYPENTIVLIIDKREIKEINLFDIRNYYPCLYSYGYFHKYFNKIDTSMLAITGAKLNLKPISERLHNESYIYELFAELIFEPLPFIKFTLLYQIIELLIEKIFYVEINLILKKLKEKKIYTREFKEKIADFDSERKRINKLFQEYINSLDLATKNNLIHCCKNFLNPIKGTEDFKGDVGRAIYEVRNFIVHDYRSIPKDSLNHLILLNQKFEIFCIELLINY